MFSKRLKGLHVEKLQVVSQNLGRSLRLMLKARQANMTKHMFSFTFLEQ